MVILKDLSRNVITQSDSNLRPPRHKSERRGEEWEHDLQVILVIFLYWLSVQTEVNTAISVTSDGNVQVVLQDDSGKASSKLAALIAADLDAGKLLSEIDVRSM